METVLLQRKEDDTPDQGTTGVITCPSGRAFYSLELPDRGNHPMTSRIPTGKFICRLEESQHFHNKDGSKATLYHILNVPGRTSVKMHWGNFAGDTEL